MKQDKDKTKESWNQRNIKQKKDGTRER